MAPLDSRMKNPARIAPARPGRTTITTCQGASKQELYKFKSASDRAISLRV